MPRKHNRSIVVGSVQDVGVSAEGVIPALRALQDDLEALIDSDGLLASTRYEWINMILRLTRSASAGIENDPYPGVDADELCVAVPILWSGRTLTAPEYALSARSAALRGLVWVADQFGVPAAKIRAASGERTSE